MSTFLRASLKLLLVTALLGYVFSTIQWRDRVVVVDSHGKVVEESTGRIVGEWDGELVDFVADQEISSGPQQVSTGLLQNGSWVTVTPGLLTYFIHLDKLIFALGAFTWLTAMIVGSTRWWWLLRVNDLEISLFEALRLSWIGLFFNNFVPGQTGGDVVKAVAVMKRCPGGRVRALMSVVVDRILGLGSLAVLGSVVVLFNFERFAVIAVAVWGVLLLVVAIGALGLSRRVRRLSHLDEILPHLPQWIATPLSRVDRAISWYRDHRMGVLAWLLIGVANHILTVSSILLMGRALGVGMPWDEYFALIPVILMVSALPLAPAGWGVGEAMFGTLFGTYGAEYLSAGIPNPEQVMATRGVALSVLYRVHLALWSLLGGLSMAARGGREHNQLEKDE